MIKYNIEGLDNLLEQIEELEYNISDDAIEVVLENIGVTQVARTRKNFNNGLDPYGKKWAPFKNIPSKKRGGPSAQIMLDTQRLLGSIMSSANSGELQLSTSIYYAPFHQNGTDKMVKRSILPDERGLPEQWNKDIIKIIEKVLKI